MARGGDENYQPLTSFLDLETLGRHAGRFRQLGTYRLARKLGMPQGQECRRARDPAVHRGRQVPAQQISDRICRGLGLADADRISRDGPEFGNVFRAVSQGTGFTDFRTAGIRGNGHGDLHPGNILVPTARSVRPLEQSRRYFLIDL